ncbi:MAG: hypothetical protein ACI311_01065, partial [Bacilli bacterium]
DYDNNFKIIDNVAYLPYQKELTDEEEKLFNQKLKTHEIDKIVKIGNGFKQYNLHNELDDTFTPTYNHFNRKAKAKLTKTYLKLGKINSSINVVLFSLILVLVILIQTLLNFDSTKIYVNNINIDNKDIIMIHKTDVEAATSSPTKFLRFNEEDKINLFNNYEGTYYPIVNFILDINNLGNPTNTEAGYIHTLKEYVNQHGFYLSNPIGTAIVDDQYLINRYQNENGELEILAGSLDDCRSSLNLIITDYIADSIIDTHYELGMNETYEDLIDFTYLCYPHNKSISTNNSGRIGCIIKTNYKEKYKELFDKYEDLKAKGFPIKETNELTQSKLYENYFSNIVNGSLSLSFSNNSNFLNEAKVNITTVKNHFSNKGLFASTDLIPSDFDIQYDSVFMSKDSLNDDEIIIKLSEALEYAKLLQVDTAEELIGQTINIIKTVDDTLSGEVIDSFSLKIVGFNEYHFLISPNNLNRTAAMQIFEVGYLFPTYENCSTIINNTVNHNFYLSDVNTSIYSVVLKTIALFGDIFRILNALLIIILVVFFSSFANKTIISKSYQIGVFKSLGMPLKDITSIFLIKNIIFSILSLILTTALIFPFLELANYLLMNAYSIFFGKSINIIKIFSFQSNIFIFNYLLVIAIFIIFTLVPIISTKRISPAKIVNNKNE